MFDYAKVTDEQIGKLGMRAAKRHFEGALDDGLLSGDSLSVSLGMVGPDGSYVELAREGFGDDGEDFFANISPKDGKIATALSYRMDSRQATANYGEPNSKKPCWWTGAIFHKATVTLKSGRILTREFIGGGSGVQGPFDADTVSAGLRRMDAVWSERELAREAAAVSA
jgi:hypothetical protein